MKVNKETMEKLRSLYYNLTGSGAVFDDYCFYNMWCNHGSWIKCFWLCKHAIDKMLEEGKKPMYKLYSAVSGEAQPYETVDGYYNF